jgi:hypothetical protein
MLSGFKNNIFFRDVGHLQRAPAHSRVRVREVGREDLNDGSEVRQHQRAHVVEHTAQHVHRRFFVLRRVALQSS